MLFVLFLIYKKNVICAILCTPLELFNKFLLLGKFFLYSTYVVASMNLPFALNLIVLGKEHIICVLMVNATRCLNTIVEPNVLYLSFTCFKTLQIETCTVVPVQKHIPWVKQVKLIEMTGIG